MIEESSPDLYLLDVTMTGMSGLVLAEALREQGICEPIIMISADAQERHHINNPDVAHNFYMVKPIKVQTLIDKIGVLLSLDWHFGGARPKPVFPAQSRVWNIPDHMFIHQLRDYAEIGYAKGFYDTLEAIENDNLLSTELVQYLFQLAKQVRFDKVIDILNGKPVL